MSKHIIKDGAIVADHLIHLDMDAPLPNADFTVPYRRYGLQRAALENNPYFKGVSVNGVDDDIYAIGSALLAFDLICLGFPQYVDGQCYSFARLLRSRFGYKGELRAIGNVLQDQLHYMHRCGINAFEVEAGKDLNQALKALGDFSVRYQLV